MRHRYLAVWALVLGTAAHAQSPRNTLSLPSVAGWQGDQVTVALQSVFRDSVSGMVATILFDPTVVRVTQVRAGTAMSGFSLESSITAGRVRLAMAAARPVAGTATAVELTAHLIGAPGSSSLLDLAAATLNEGDLDVGLTGGMVTIYREIHLLGSVLYYSGRQPVPGTVVTLRTGTGSPAAADTTDDSGAYALRRIVPGPYRLSASRAAAPTPAVDVVDVSQILRHLVGLTELSAEQQLAADVSGNGRLGTNDAGLILRYLVGLETAFPAGPLWHFTPAEVSFAPLLETQVQGFVAFCRGDADGDWNAQAPAGKLSTAAAGPSLSLDEVPLGRGEGVGFALRGDGLRGVVGGMATLTYDPALLAVEEVSAVGLARECLLATNTSQPGQIRLAFAGARPQYGSGELVRLRFRGEAPAGTTTELTVASASLDGVTLPPPASQRYTFGRRHEDFDRDGRIGFADFFLFVDHFGSGEAGYDLDGDGVVGLEDFFLLADTFGSASQGKLAALAEELLGLPAANRLLASYPNPFNSATVVRFRTARPGPVEVAIWAPNGQRVRTLLAGSLGAGRHEVLWDGRDERGSQAATGVYVIRLQAGSFAQAGKVLLVR
ncbi:MAG: FlgD immunoglobulin-like domain containing protein [Candidatus Latescibacterota bacterium]